MKSAAECLSIAKAKREAAREEYREFQRIRNRMAGISAQRRHETAEETRRRRLRMNQESSARTRYADGIYQRTLENFVQTSEMEQSLLSLEAASLRASRDALAKQVLDLQQRLVALRGDKGDEDEDEFENVCSTQELLARTAHIPECRMTPEMFAESLMGVPACPAL